MHTTLTLPVVSGIVYPEDDGQPMSDNTRQFLWIFVIYGNLAAQYRDRQDVFVGGNLLWYPEEGHPETGNAPDVFVVFGRPKGHRSSYKQWEEGNIPLTVVFEILSPGNSATQMDKKLLFYEDHGVEEYYIYDPDDNHLMVYQRQGQVLRRIRPVQNHVSPRLGIRFDLSGEELVIFGPDGQRFLTFEELKANTEQAQKQADQARQALRRLAELSRKARLQQATAEDLAELERLENEASANPA